MEIVGMRGEISKGKLNLKIILKNGIVKIVQWLLFPTIICIMIFPHL